MGVFTGDDNGPPVNQPDEVKQDERGIPTDVEGVFAQGVVKHGNVEFPVFDCEPDEFFGNMQDNRKRLRFKSGSAPQQYMSKTKYSIPFYVRTTKDDKVYTRKIK